MKNKVLLNLAWLLAILFMSGCANDVDVFEQPDNAEGLKSFTSFTASLDDVAGTRASLDATSTDGVRRVSWQEGDVISVYSDIDTKLRQFKLTSVSEDNQATFTGEEVSGYRYYAVFAPQQTITVDDEQVSMVHFNEGGTDISTASGQDANFVAPMVATSKNRKLVFKQITGIIQITVGNILQIDDLVLRGNNGEVLSDESFVDLSETQPIMRVSQHANATGCGGIYSKLDNEYVDIYYSIPPTVFEKGFTIEMKGIDKDGDEFEVGKKYNSRLEVEAGTISRFSAVDINAELEAPHEGKEAYAVLNGDKLTFYFDREKDGKEGTVYMYDDLVKTTIFLYNSVFGDKTDYIHYATFDPSFVYYKPTSTYALFFGLKSLKAITGLEYLRTSRVTDMKNMFKGCSSLTKIDVSGFKTSKVTNMNSMFAGCSSLTCLDVSGFDTSGVADMNSMFANCTFLKTIYGGNWSNISNSSNMFTGCNNLTGEKGSTKATRHIYTDSRSAHIDGGYSNPGFFTDIANDQPSENAEPYYVIKGNTLTLYYDDQMDERAGAQPGWLHGVNTDENVVYAIITPTCRFYKPTTASYMFYGYGKLERIMGLDYLDTSEVTDMNCMFNECSSLTSLDLSGFDTSKVTYMREMFIGCSSLTSLDLSGFDTSKVTNMWEMFMGCSSLTSLDLSGFDTSKVTDMFAMFMDCKSLETIYGGNWNYININELMFAGCPNLVGGQGSRLGGDNVYDDGRSAHIDGGPSNPGLFTAKEE